MEPFELMELIADRPDENTFGTCGLEPSELVYTLACRAHEQPFSELLGWATERRREHLGQHGVGGRRILGQVEEHRRDRVGEPLRVDPLPSQMPVQALEGLAEVLPASCCSRRPATRRRGAPRVASRRPTPNSPSRWVVRRAGLGRGADASPPSSRTLPRTVRSLVAGAPEALGRPPRTWATAPPMRSRPPDSPARKSQDRRRRRVCRPRAGRSQPAPSLTAPDLARLGVRASSRPSWRRSPEVPRRAPRGHRATAVRRRGDRSRSATSGQLGSRGVRSRSGRRSMRAPRRPRSSTGDGHRTRSEEPPFLGIGTLFDVFRTFIGASIV